MTISVFPNTSGDVILTLNSHDDGSVTFDVVNANGAVKPFGTIHRITDGGGHVEDHAPICADDIGFERENERVKVVFD